jgi:O-antigen/teichoic acid export membrane protein
VSCSPIPGLGRPRTTHQAGERLRENTTEVLRDATTAREGRMFRGAPILRIRSTARRGAWALLDQILSSGTNFATGIVIARTLGPAGYGTFALAFGAWLLIMGFGRALITQPYMVTESGAPKAEWKGATSSAAGAILVLGVAAGVLFLAVGLVFGVQSPTGLALVTVGLFAGPLALQDFWRFAAFSQQVPRKAAANDAVWALAQAAALGTLIAVDMLTATTAVAAWGTGALAGAVYGIWQFRVWPTFGRSVRAWVHKIAALGGWFALSSAIYQIGSYAVLIMVGASLGRAALGGLRSTMNLFAPAQLVAISGESIMLPTAARKVRNGRGADLRSVCMVYSLVLATCFAVAGGALMLFGPDIYRLVFGNEFTQYATLIPPILAQTVAAALASGPSIGIRALAEGRRLAVIQTASSFARVVLVAAALPLGLTAAAWGLAIAEMGRAVISWIVFRSALRRPASTAAVRPPERLPVTTDPQLTE